MNFWDLFEINNRNAEVSAFLNNVRAVINVAAEFRSSG